MRLRQYVTNSTTAISVSSFSSGAFGIPRDNQWNTAGTTRPIVLRSSIVVPRPAAVRLKRCTGWRSPPTSADGAEHQQHVADDRAGQRRLDQVRQSLAEREDSDDELRSVAERRIQQAADATAQVLGQRLGGIADQGRERQDREHGRQKDGDVTVGREQMQQNRDRHEEEQDGQGARDAIGHC